MKPPKEKLKGFQITLPLVDVHAPEYRREERIQRLVDQKGLTRQEAETAVDNVILTKEQQLGQTASDNSWIHYV